MAVVGTCPRCGTPNVANARFCSSCGAALPANAPVPGWPSPEASGTPVRGRNSGPIASPSDQRRRLRIVKWVLGVIAVVGLVTLAAQGSLILPGVSGGAGGADTVIVTYHLTGSATGAGVVTYTDGSGNIQQATNVKVPLTRSGGSGDGFSVSVRHGTLVSFSAQNAGASGDLDCSIEANGVVINTGHAQGGYAIVTCSATIP